MMILATAQKEVFRRGNLSVSCMSFSGSHTVVYESCLSISNDGRGVDNILYCRPASLLLWVLIQAFRISVVGCENDKAFCFSVYLYLHLLPSYSTSNKVMFSHTQHAFSFRRLSLAFLRFQLIACICKHFLIYLVIISVILQVQVSLFLTKHMFCSLRTQ